MSEEQLSGLPEPKQVPKMPKTSKSKGGVIKVETMTLNQFRSYLKGIMFVGGPTWRPDREQWEAIVAIIDKLTIDSPAQSVQQYAAPAYSVPQSNGWDQTAPSWQPMPAPQPRPELTSALSANGEDGPYASPFV